MEQIIDYILIATVSVISVVLHECAHGYVAYRCGDDTAKASGRLTLNPIAHIDPLGLLSLILFKFGWAKPVPINPNNFREQKRGMIAVSLAGVSANMLLAVIFALLTRLLSYFYTESLSWLLTFLIYGIQINIGYAVFNLLPVPPLDGSKLLAAFLPRKWENWFYRYQKYLYAILVLLIFTRAINYIMNPAISFLYNLLLKLIVLS